MPKCANFQLEMEQNIKLKYVNPQLQIGMASWREVYFLSPELIKLKPEFYNGRLVYRKKAPAKELAIPKSDMG